LIFIGDFQRAWRRKPIKKDDSRRWQIMLMRRRVFGAFVHKMTVSRKAAIRAVSCTWRP
jgi:hypothetical protein